MKKLVELSDTIPTSPNVTRLAWKSESVSSKYLSLADNYKQYRTIPSVDVLITNLSDKR